MYADTPYDANHVSDSPALASRLILAEGVIVVEVFDAGTVILPRFCRNAGTFPTATPPR